MYFFIGADSSDVSTILIQLVGTTLMMIFFVNVILITKPCMIKKLNDFDLFVFLVAGWVITF